VSRWVNRWVGGECGWVDDLFGMGVGERVSVGVGGWVASVGGWVDGWLASVGGWMTCLAWAWASERVWSWVVQTEHQQPCVAGCLNHDAKACARRRGSHKQRTASENRRKCEKKTHSNEKRRRRDKKQTHDVVERKSKKPRQNVVARCRDDQEHRVGRCQRPQPAVDGVIRTHIERCNVGHHVEKAEQGVTRRPLGPC
jgi:hypothetical protein